MVRTTTAGTRSGTSKEFVKEQDVQIFIIGIVNPSGELGSDPGGRLIIEDLLINERYNGKSTSGKRGFSIGRN